MTPRNVLTVSLQGLLRVSSEAVAAALEDRLRPAQFTVVVPSSWRQSKCGVELRKPKGQTRYKVSQCEWVNKHFDGSVNLQMTNNPPPFHACLALSLITS